MIRWAVTALLLTALPASAGCILDEEAANVSAYIVAFTRMCPEFRAATEQDATDLFLASEAVSRAEQSTPECRRLVGYRIAAATAQIRPEHRRAAECKKASSRVAESESLRDVLNIFGLIRPNDGLTDDQRLDKEIQEALKSKGEYIPKPRR